MPADIQDTPVVRRPDLLEERTRRNQRRLSISDARMTTDEDEARAEQLRARGFLG
jgi:hypothetical protein